MKIVLTPDWFLGKDVLINSFSFIVLFIFSFLCFRNYKINKSKKFLYLGGGFALIALAQLAMISTKLILYYDTTVTQTVGQMIITHNIVSSVDIFYHLGFFFYRLFILAGFYIIYKFPIQKKYWEDFFLVLFFITIISILSKDFFLLFNLTSLVLLVLITKHYYLIYEKNRSGNTLMLVFAFSLLALSNAIYVFSKIEALYVMANIIELIGYITLLILIVRILNGKKKESDGHNLRHIENHPRKKRQD